MIVVEVFMMSCLVSEKPKKAAYGPGRPRGGCLIEPSFHSKPRQLLASPCACGPDLYVRSSEQGLAPDQVARLRLAVTSLVVRNHFIVEWNPSHQSRSGDTRST